MYARKPGRGAEHQGCRSGNRGAAGMPRGAARHGATRGKKQGEAPANATTSGRGRPLASIGAVKRIRRVSESPWRPPFARCAAGLGRSSIRCGRHDTANVDAPAARLRAGTDGVARTVGRVRIRSAAKASVARPACTRRCRRKTGSTRTRAGPPRSPRRIAARPDTRHHGAPRAGYRTPVPPPFTADWFSPARRSRRRVRSGSRAA